MTTYKTNGSSLLDYVLHKSAKTAELNILYCKWMQGNENASYKGLLYTADQAIPP